VGNCSFNRYRCPDNVNPAEFLADLISIDYSSAHSVYTSRKRVDGLIQSLSESLSRVIYTSQINVNDLPNVNGLSNSRKKITQRAVRKKKGTWWKQFRLLLKRAWMQVLPFLILSVFP